MDNQISQAAAALIAENLGKGLPHPGNPAANQPPTRVPMPGFRVASLPQEMAKAVNAAAQLIGEATIHLLHTAGYQLVHTDTTPAHADIAGQDWLVIRCTHCHQMLFAVDHTGHIDPTVLRTRIQQLPTDCNTGHQPTN
jgi:hypothetical protein